MNKVELMKLLDGITSPISRIEEKLGMPKSTIQKVKDGKRTLSAEWEKVLIEFIEKKGYIGLKRKKPKKEVEEVVELKVGDNKAWSKAFKSAGVKATPSGEDWTKLSRTEQMKRLRG